MHLQKEIGRHNTGPIRQKLRINETGSDRLSASLRRTPT